MAGIQNILLIETTIVTYSEKEVFIVILEISRKILKNFLKLPHIRYLVRSLFIEMINRKTREQLIFEHIATYQCLSIMICLEDYFHISASNIVRAHGQPD